MAAASLLLCSTVTFYTGQGPLALSVLPRGSCGLCCNSNVREDVTFWLYTRRNPRQPQQLTVGGHRQLAHSLLVRNHSTVLYIHGFTEKATGRSSQAVKTALLARGDYNVILVDWSPLSAAPWYRAAAHHAHQVGLYLASFLKFLHRYAVHVKYLHVVGFSLGAEVAGFAGKALHRIRLPRITGLDPAYPGYMLGGRKCHLASSDADFVDVIHTDGGVLGFDRPLGHTDFYPNGGMPIQPGCRFKELLHQRDLRNYVACSHSRAWRFFVESILEPRAFPAVRCHSFSAFRHHRCPWGNHTQYMGFGVDSRFRGKFYLRTRDRSPYSLKSKRVGRWWHNY